MKRDNPYFPRRLMPAIAALLVFVFLGGCSSARFIATGAAYPPQSDECSIEVFSSKLPDREYEELGIIEGEGSLGADTLEKILPKMKREACRAGGEGMILTSNQKFSSELLGDDGDDKLNVTATVIRWIN